LEGKNILEKLGKKSISATDIASQFWCEKQMELNYLYGKRYTKEMAKGAEIHAELQAETYIPLAITPINYTDFLYKEFYENYLSLKGLKEKGVGREIRIYGSINGFKIIGKIDELRLEKGSVVVIENKTRETRYAINEAVVRPHKIQIMLYKRMLDDIIAKRYTHENFENTYLKGLKPLSDRFAEELKALGIARELQSIEGIYKKMFDEIYTMPKVSDELELVYIDRFTGERVETIRFKYNEEELNKLLIEAMRYWNGEVKARPVAEDEKWKCKFCRFYGKECRVWYNETL
jgi:exonuclease V